MRPPVSVIILSYHRPELLEQAVRSVCSQSHRPLEIIVVDNKSPSSPKIATLMAHFPEVRFISNATNLGFTGGMNIGLRAATGQYVHFTEDDIVLEPEAIEAFVRHAEAHREVGLLSGIMLNEGLGTIRCAGGRVELGPVFRKTLLALNERYCGQFRDPYEVDYVPGSMMFGSREFLSRLGGFRPDFFMYWDDVELCVRVARTGKKIVIVPQARCRHIDGSTFTFRPVIEFHKMKNSFATYALHAPVRVFPEFALRYMGWDVLRRFVRKPREGLVAAAAVAWFGANCPRLVRERFSVSRMVARLRAHSVGGA